MVLKVSQVAYFMKKHANTRNPAYTLGLRSVEASKAGIIATIEPVVATIIGIVCFSETLTILSGMGIVLVLTAVTILNRK